MRADVRISEEKLLRRFLDFLNQEPGASFDSGTLRDTHGVPLLKIRCLADADAARREGWRLFGMLADPRRWRLAEAEANTGDATGFKLFSSGQRHEPAIAVPSCTSGLALAHSMVVVARTTTTRQRDPLSNRVSICCSCRKFFLRKTTKASAFCHDRCRWRHRREAERAA